MNTQKVRWAIVLSAVCAMISSFCSADSSPVALDWQNPARWISDGGWTVNADGEQAIRLALTDEARHNKLVMLRIPEKAYQRYRLRIRFQQQPLTATVELAVGLAEGKMLSNLRDHFADYSQQMAECWTLRGLERQDGQTVFDTVIGTDKKINTIAFVGYGNPKDVAAIKVFDLALLPPTSEEWFTWPVSQKTTQRVVPRHPAQDFFPFGVYIPGEYISLYGAAVGINDTRQALDRMLEDIASRGCNYVYFVNLMGNDIEWVDPLCRRYGLRYTFDLPEANPKYHSWQETMRAGMEYAARYRNNPTILTWAFGEEFEMEHTDNLILLHELVHAVDPSKTLSLIHHRLQPAKASFDRDDVRIAFRDAYPFFTMAQHGPVSYAAQINYYENEMDRMWQMIPKGASVWAMPQAAYDYLKEGDEMKVYMRIDNREQIRIQAWAALGMGCTGVCYFFYGPASDVVNPKNLGPSGVLDKQGKPTFMLEEITELAGRIVPVGPIIARMERSGTPISSNHPELRAYLFRRLDDGKAYVIAYNRSITQAISGKIRLPFDLKAEVQDLVNKKSLSVEQKNQFGLTLRPADGTVIALQTVGKQ